VTKEIVGEQGFHAVSIEAVARRAGITRPVVYEHFGDLKGLLEALVAREGARALAQLAAILPHVRSAEGGGREDLLAGLRGTITAGRDAVVAALAEVVRPGIGPGSASPDPALTARMLSATADEAARLLLTDPAEYPIDRLIAHADWVLSSLSPGRR